MPLNKRIPIELTDDEIEQSIIRFESLLTQWKANGTYPGKYCRICSHEFRDEINRLMLRNESYKKLEQRYNLPYENFYRHFARHLCLAVIYRGNNELEELIPSHTRALAKEGFPINGNILSQLAWVTKQFVMLKEIESDKLFRRANPYLDFNTAEYERKILRIRETIMIMEGIRGRKRGVRKAPNLIQDFMDPEWLTPQQKEELKKAEMLRQKNAKRAMEVIHDERAAKANIRVPNPGTEGHRASKDGTPGHDAVKNTG